MRRLGVIALLALALGALLAGPAAGATGRVDVKVDLPARASGSLPALVLAFPLDPELASVGAAMPKGRATLVLEAGPWIVATSAPGKNGKAVVEAELVVVAAGKRTPLAAAATGGPSLAVGELKVTAPGVGDPYTRKVAGAYAAALLTKAAATSPCKPSVAPGSQFSKNPLWKAIQQATAKAARSGPPSVRPAAQAAAATFQAGSGASTLSGTVTQTGGSGGAAGTFRVTDSTGKVTYERSYSGQGSVQAMLDQALKDAVAALCNERRRVQVDVTFSFDTSDTEARGVGIVVLSAVGVEAVGPDGKVEKGAYEYERPVSWTTRDVAVTGLRCQVTLGSIDVGPQESAPTFLATETNGRYSLQLAPTILVGYDYVTPCGGSGAVPLSLAIVPALVLELPGLDQETTRSGQQTLGGATSTYSVSAKVTRLPPSS